MPTDDFNRANDGLGTDWVVDIGTGQISGSRAKFTGNQAPNVARWGTALATSDHSSQIENWVRSNYSGPSVRGTSAGGTARFVAALLQGAGNNYVQTFKRNANTWTQLASGAITYGTGAVIKLDATGSGTGTFIAYYNGTALTTANHSDTSLDTLLFTGFVTQDSTAELDNWLGTLLGTGTGTVFNLERIERHALRGVERGVLRGVLTWLT